MASVRRKVTRVGSYKPKKRRVIKTDKKKSIERTPVSTNTHFITTPAGYCPVRLDSMEPEDITLWVEDIKKLGNHTVQSCCYWIRDFYDINGPDYRQVRDWIYENSSTLGLRSFPRNK